MKITLALISVLALGGCAAGEAAAAQPPAGPSATPVRLSPIDRRPIREPLRVPGLVQPRDTYELGFPGGGVVLGVTADEGDEVRAGAILARLDATGARASWTQAREGLARAERDLDRARRLSEGGSLPTASFEDATTGTELARASVAAAGFALRYSALRSPVDGWIDARLVDEGEVVGPGQPVFRIASRARGFVVRVAVPDRAVARLREGSEAVVTLDAFADRPIAARVVEVGRMPSPGTGTFDVDLAFEAPEGIVLRTGLVARASIPIGDTYHASVPLSALIDGHDREAAVYTIRDGRASRVPVRIAFFLEDRAALATDLAGVDRVISAGAERLTEGSAIVAVAE